MTTPGTATQPLDEVEEIEIVEDDAGTDAGGAGDAAAVGAGDGARGGTPAADAWRGPSAGRWVLFVVIALVVLAVDQLSKAWLVATLPNAGDGLVLIDGLLNVVHGRNSGALFGLLPQSAPVFAVVSFGVVALIVVYHRRAGRGILVSVALGLLLGGAIGNLIDRLRFGYVVDWIDMGIGQWRFYTYNVADAAITTAILLLLLMALVPRVGDWGSDD